MFAFTGRVADGWGADATTEDNPWSDMVEWEHFATPEWTAEEWHQWWTQWGTWVEYTEEEWEEWAEDYYDAMRWDTLCRHGYLCMDDQLFPFMKVEVDLAAERRRAELEVLVELALEERDRYLWQWSGPRKK